MALLSLLSLPSPATIVIVRMHTDGEVEAVLVNGFKEPSECGVRGSPQGLLQVVTCPVKSAVFRVETHVGTVGSAPVAQATRGIRYQLHLLRGQHFLVAKFTFKKNISSLKMKRTEVI